MTTMKLWVYKPPNQIDVLNSYVQKSTDNLVVYENLNDNEIMSSITLSNKNKLLPFNIFVFN